MFSLVKRMMKEYYTLLIKMALNTPKKKNKGYYKLRSPSESENVIWFVMCASIVGSVHNLIKFSQSWYVFVCDFISIMKICKHQFQVPYVP